MKVVAWTVVGGMGGGDMVQHPACSEPDIALGICATPPGNLGQG